MTDYNDGEFHLWHGGDCPVHPQSVVDVRFRDSELQSEELPARWWEWGHGGYGTDIICFRVVTPYRAPVQLPDTIGPDHPAVQAVDLRAVREALVEHNDLLRSAFQIAEREGVTQKIASTNWDAFYNRVTVILKRHHETVNGARVALALIDGGRADG